MTKKLLSVIILTFIVLSFTSCGRGRDISSTDLTSSNETSHTDSSVDSSTVSEETSGVESGTESGEPGQSGDSQNPSSSGGNPVSSSTPPSSSSSRPPISSSSTPPPPTSSTAPPSSTVPPTSSSTPVAPFDINVYVKYAEAYGQSIGLELKYLSGDSWNAPLNIYSTQTDAKIKEGIELDCKGLKREGMKYFSIEVKAVKEGQWQMYFYYDVY